MIQAIVVAVITFVVSGPFWGLVGAGLGRTRFDGIAVAVVPATVGALALYAHAAEGFGMRLKVVNVTSSPIAIERASGCMRLRPRPNAPKVHGAFGECEISGTPEGPYSFDAPHEPTPLIVPSSGGVLYVQVISGALRYRRKLPLVPYWKDVARLAIDDPLAPTDEQGNQMYFDHFNIQSLEVRLQVNGKVRRLPVNLRFREISAKDST